MPDITVHLPSGHVLHFAPGTTQEQIRAAMAKIGGSRPGAIREQFEGGVEQMKSGFKSLMTGQGTLGLGEVGIGALGAVTSPLAPVFRTTENLARTAALSMIAPGLAAQQATKMFNMTEDRPTTGNPIADLVADIGIGLIPIGGGVSLAGKLGRAGRVARAAKQTRPVRGLLPEARIDVPTAGAVMRAEPATAVRSLEALKEIRTSKEFRALEPAERSNVVAELRRLQKELPKEAIARIKAEVPAKGTPAGPVLDRVDNILTDTRTPVPGMSLRDIPREMQRRFVSEFTPMRVAERKVYKIEGKELPRLDLARKFEQVNGAVGKAEADVIEFRRAVVEPLDSAGINLKDMERYLFLRRTEQRLLDNPKIKRVSEFTPERARTGLNELRQAIGADKFNAIEQIAVGPYQEMMDRALRLQVDSGRMTEKLYQQIKASNDFYAPFEVLQDIEKIETGTGRNIATLQPLTRKITGISSEDFHVALLKPSLEQVYKSRLLAEKNRKMLELDKLASIDTRGIAARRLAAGEEARVGYEAVNYFKDGVKSQLEVTKDIAEAVKGMNAAQTGLVAWGLSKAAIPFRAGATTFNLAFQPVNLLFADLPRAAFISRIGIRNPVDAFRFVGDWVHSFATAVTGNLWKANELYLDTLKSGVLNSTIQRIITPGAFSKGTALLSPSRAARLKELTLDKTAKFANAIEETTKILGFKRGRRVFRPDQFEEMVTEIRNFSGSPDFARRGADTAVLNLIFMFFNARMQGTASDLARLFGQAEGGAKATTAAWARLSGAVGVPTTALMLRNLSPEYVEDYFKLSQTERDNYFMIPSDQFFTDDEGNQVREFWRIPKREVVGLLGNMIEAAIIEMHDKDPNAIRNYAVTFLENISPVSIQGEREERMESVVSSTNPLIKAPVEFATGRDTFFHSNVIPQRLKGASPENQYRDTTPELFVRAGRSLGMSPIVLQKLLQGFTAGLFTQFTPGKPEEGRSPLSKFPVIKRFFRSSVVEDRQFDEDFARIATQQADERVTLKREAEKMYDALRDLPQGSRLGQIRAIRAKDQKVGDLLRQIDQERGLGLTYDDRRLKSLGVENGARAEMISLQAGRLDEAERKTYLADLRKKKILTREVEKQMREAVQ